MQLFQQQYKIFGSFGASMRNIRDSLAKMADGLTPVIDTEVALADFERGLARLESRQVFGKIIVQFLRRGMPMQARCSRRLRRGCKARSATRCSACSPSGCSRHRG